MAEVEGSTITGSGASGAAVASVTPPEGFISLAEHEAKTQGLAAKAAQLLKEKKILEGKTGTEFDIEEHKRLKDAEAQREQEEAKRRGEFDKLSAAKDAQHQKELTLEREKAQRLAQSLNGRIVQGEASRALAKAKAVSPDLLLPHVQAAVEVIEENGEYVARIKDAKAGGYRFGPKGEYMTVEEFVATDLVEKFPSAFEGHQASGGGATGKSNGGAVVNGKEINHLPPDERLAKAFELGAQRR